MQISDFSWKSDGKDPTLLHGINSPAAEWWFQLIEYLIHMAYTYPPLAIPLLSFRLLA